MKRIKLMLLSLALVAVVGGALAFKARYNVSYCTTLAAQDLFGNSTCSDLAGVALKCTSTWHQSTATTIDPQRIYCTTTAIFSPVQNTYTCPANKACLPTTYSIKTD